jgi:hypothetical protein
VTVATGAAVRLVLVAAEQQGAAVWISTAVSSVLAVVAAVLAYRSNSKATKVEYDSSLRDDQRELIKELRADNAEQRLRLTDQGHELHLSRIRIDNLESALRAAGIAVPEP